MFIYSIQFLQCTLTTCLDQTTECIICKSWRNIHYYVMILISLNYFLFWKILLREWIGPAMILHVCLLIPNRYRLWRVCTSQLIIHCADCMMCCSLALACVVDELNQTVMEEVRMYLVKAVKHWTSTDCTFLNLLLSCIGNGVDLTLPFKVLGDCERRGGGVVYWHVGFLLQFTTLQFEFQIFITTPRSQLLNLQPASRLISIVYQFN